MGNDAISLEPPPLDSVLAFGAQKGLTNDQQAQAVMKWRDYTRDYYEKDIAADDPKKWFDGNAAVDKTVSDALWNLRGTKDEADGFPAFYQAPQSSNGYLPLTAAGGKQVGSYQFQQGTGGKADILVNLPDPKGDGMVSSLLKVPMIHDWDVEAAAETALAQQRQAERYSESSGGGDPEAALGAAMARPGFDNQARAAELRVAQLSGPDAKSILQSEAIHSAFQASPAGKKFEEWHPGEDIARGFQGMRLGAQYAVADALGADSMLQAQTGQSDAGKKEIQDAIGALDQAYPGTTYTGPGGKVLRGATELLGSMPLVLNPGGVAILAASTYGGTKAGALNAADAADAQGKALEKSHPDLAKKFTDLAADMRDNASLHGALAATTIAGLGRLLPEANTVLGGATRGAAEWGGIAAGQDQLNQDFNKTPPNPMAVLEGIISGALVGGVSKLGSKAPDPAQPAAPAQPGPTMGGPPPADDWTGATAPPPDPNAAGTPPQPAPGPQPQPGPQQSGTNRASSGTNQGQNGTNRQQSGTSSPPPGPQATPPPPKGPAAKQFNSQAEFNVFMDNAVKSGDVEQASKAFAMNADRWRIGWVKDRIKQGDEYQQFINSVFGGRTNAEHSAYVQSQADAGQNGPRPASGSTGRSGTASPPEPARAAADRGTGPVEPPPAPPEPAAAPKPPETPVEAPAPATTPAQAPAPEAPTAPAAVKRGATPSPDLPEWMKPPIRQGSELAATSVIESSTVDDFVDEQHVQFDKYYKPGQGKEYEAKISELRRELGLRPGEAAYVLQDPNPAEAIGHVYGARVGYQNVGESPEHRAAYVEAMDQAVKTVERVSGKTAASNVRPPFPPVPAAFPHAPEPAPVKKTAAIGGARSFSQRQPAAARLFSEDPVVQFIKGTLGGIMSPSAAKRTPDTYQGNKTAYEANPANWEDAQKLSHPTHNQIYRGTTRPDVAADELYKAGLIPDAHPSTMWNALDSASKSAREQAGGASRESKAEAQTVDFEKQSLRPNAAGKLPVLSDDLKPGDQVQIAGESLEVKDVDEHGNVTLRDGTRFGIQHVNKGQILYVQDHTTEKTPEGETLFPPGWDEPPDMSQPLELKPQTDAEIAAEKARAKLEARQAAPLKGSAGEMGTPDLLDTTAGDTPLFNQPAAKPESAKLKKLTPKNTFEALKKHFTPGAIVPSYSGQDRVIAFHGNDLGNWRVDVHAVDKNGADIPGERDRSHMTEPGRKVLEKALNAPEQPAAPKSGSLPHELQAPDKKMLSNSIIRGNYEVKTQRAINEGRPVNAAMAAALGISLPAGYAIGTNGIAAPRPDARVIQEAVNLGHPVKADDADAAGVKLPEGYVTGADNIARPGNDWTAATDGSTTDIGEPPPPSAPGIVFGAFGAIPEPSLRRATPLDRATAAWSAKLQRSFQDARRAIQSIHKVAKTDAERAAITVYVEAGGDMAKLGRWATAQPAPGVISVGGKAFKRGLDVYRKASQDAMRLTPAQIAVAQKIRDTFDILHKRGVRAGIINAFRDNYIPHIWDLDQGAGTGGSRRLKRDFRFAKARTYDTIFDGVMDGMIPKTLDVAKTLPAYLHEMNSVVADRQFVHDVSQGFDSDGRPLVIPRGNIKILDGNHDDRTYLVSPRGSAGDPKDIHGNDFDQRDYKMMEDQPALEKWMWKGSDTAGNPIFMNSELAVHPSLYRRITAMMGQSKFRKWYNSPSASWSKGAPVGKALLKFFDKTQGVMKREMFSLYAPFHQVQEGTHAVGHLVNPVFGLLNIDLRQPGPADASRHGLMIQPDRASMSHYLQGVGSGETWVSRALKAVHIPGLNKTHALAWLGHGAEAYQDYLFHSYIPRLKYTTYEHILARARKEFAPMIAAGKASDEDLKFLSAHYVNSAFGHQNYALLDRSPTLQHFLQMGLLSPDFTEGRVRFVGQAVQGLNPHNPVGREQFRAVAFLAAAMAGTAYVLAKSFGGEWDWKHPFEVKFGNRKFSMRSVPEDLLKFITDTKNQMPEWIGGNSRKTGNDFVTARINPTVQSAYQLVSGINWRGEKVKPGDTLTEAVGKFSPLTLRQLPGIRDLVDSTHSSPVPPMQQFAGAFGLKISRFSPITDAYELANQWKAKNGIASDYSGTYPVSQYQQLRYAIEDGRIDDAAAEYNKLAAKMKPAQIDKGFKMSVEHSFTGSKANDIKFRQSLAGDDKAVYDAAVDRRKMILNTYPQVKQAAQQGKK